LASPENRTLDPVAQGEIIAIQSNDCQCRAPEWSPDNKWVVFSNFKEIYRVSIDGGVPEQLTSEGMKLRKFAVQNTSHTRAPRSLRSE
jgi:Tol biopolymer transport system component